MNDQLLKTLQEVHLAVWNEKDRAKRDALIQTIYADNIKMYDKEFVLHGNTEVSDFIGKLHTDDPDFNFSAAKPMESIQNGARLYGHIRTGQGVLHSMDFFILEEGKVLHLYAFMDMP
jgi:hypothetical protein